MNVTLYDHNGTPIRCYRCGKLAQALINLSVNCASTIPSNMQPVCDEHNPYRFRWRKHAPTT